MADKKISELTELTTPDGTEELVVNDSGVSKKVQIDNLIADNGLSGDKIDGGTISNFTSTGIDDNATSTAITIDASENVTLSGDIKIEKATTGTVEVKNTNNPVANAEVIGSFQVYGSDVSSGGVGIRTKIETISESPTGDIYALALSTSYANAAPVERMRIKGAGDVTVSTGNLVIGTSGKGIDFSADGNAAGMTSEVLDDYEEGTWTAVITFGDASVGVTYNNQSGFYTKIGDIVHIHCYVALSSKGTSVGDFKLTGFPFATLGTTGSYTSPSINVGNINFADYPQSYTPLGATFAYFQESTNAGANSQMDNTNFADNSSFMFNATYTV